jgi:hypothetical protein
VHHADNLERAATGYYGCMRRSVGWMLAWVACVSCYRPLDFTGMLTDAAGDGRGPADASAACPADAMAQPGDAGLIDSGTSSCFFSSLTGGGSAGPEGDWVITGAPNTIGADSGSSDVVLYGTFDQAGDEVTLTNVDTIEEVMVPGGSVEVEVTALPTDGAEVGLVVQSTSTTARMVVAIEAGRVVSEFLDSDGTVIASDDGSCTPPFTGGFIRIVLGSGNLASTEWSTDGSHWVPQLLDVMTLAQGSQFLDRLELFWNGSGSGSASAGLANFTIYCTR